MYIGRKRFNKNKIKAIGDIFAVEAAVFTITSFYRYETVILIYLFVRIVCIILESVFKRRKIRSEE